MTNRGSGPDRLQSAASPLLSVGVSHQCICSQGFSGWGPAGTGAEISLAPETTVRSLGFFALRRASSNATGSTSFPGRQPIQATTEFLATDSQIPRSAVSFLFPSPPPLSRCRPSVSLLESLRNTSGFSAHVPGMSGLALWTVPSSSPA